MSDSEHPEQFQRLLTENLRIAEENNVMLHRMQFWGRVAFWAKVVIWSVVLLLPIIFYHSISSLGSIFPGGQKNTGSSTSSSLFGFPSPGEVLTATHK